MKNYKESIVCFGNKTIVLQNVSQKVISREPKKDSLLLIFTCTT